MLAIGASKLMLTMSFASSCAFHHPVQWNLERNMCRELRQLNRGGDTTYDQS